MTDKLPPDRVATPRISCFVEAQCLLGEGPVWDTVRNGLWWVDILQQRVYFADSTGASLQHWTLPEPIGFVIPRPDGELWGGLKSGLHRLQLNNSGESALNRVDYLDADSPDMRFNDATSDAQGNLYATTMDIHEKHPQGKVFHYPATPDGHLAESRPVAEGFMIANGPAISPDGKTLYIVESKGHSGRAKGIWRAAIRPDGTLEAETHWLNWPYTGSPDGGTIDAEGNLWLGNYDGHTIRQFSADGELLRAIDLPVRNPTKVAIDDDGRLLVTSARKGATKDQLNRYPLTGSVLMIHLD